MDQNLAIWFAAKAR